MKKLFSLKVCFVLLFSVVSISLFSQDKLIALKSTETMSIDGNANEAIWARATWYTIDQLWLGAQPSASDFTGRYKLVWDAGYLYVLAEISDDKLSDVYPDPLTNYWDDDCLEIFLDENRSKGSHEGNYNGWAEHISIFGDVVDEGPHLYNDNVLMKYTKSGNVYTWESRLKIFGENYVYNGINTPLTLTAGKIMGFSVAYCDNDGGSTRESFIGSGVVPLADKNVGYKICDYYQELTLLENEPPLPELPGVIEAENYDSMFGIQLEACSDIGNGKDVGYFDVNDNLTYKVNVKKTGNYKVVFRLASTAANAKIELFSNNVSLATLTAVTPTGAWQTWQDFVLSSDVFLTSGPQTLKIVARTNGFNLNWMSFDFATSIESVESSDFTVFPNPVNNILYITFSNSDNIDELILYNIDGVEVYHAANLKDVAQIDLSQLNVKGVVFVKIKQNNKFSVKKVVVK